MDFAFDSLQAFLQMGKHGFYVWLCFGLTALVMLLNVLMTKASRKRIEREIFQQQERQRKQAENFSN